MVLDTWEAARPLDFGQAPNAAEGRAGLLRAWYAVGWATDCQGQMLVAALARRRTVCCTGLVHPDTAAACSTSAALYARRTRRGSTKCPPPLLHPPIGVVRSSLLLNFLLDVMLSVYITCSITKINRTGVDLPWRFLMHAFTYFVMIRGKVTCGAGQKRLL